MRSVVPQNWTESTNNEETYKSQFHETRRASARRGGIEPDDELGARQPSSATIASLALTSTSSVTSRQDALGAGDTSVSQRILGLGGTGRRSGREGPGAPDGTSEGHGTMLGLASQSSQTYPKEKEYKEGVCLQLWSDSLSSPLSSSSRLDSFQAACDVLRAPGVRYALGQSLQAACFVPCTRTHIFVRPCRCMSRSRPVSTVKL